MWLRTPQKARDAWLCGVGKRPNHSETWAAVPFCTKNCPNWHQTVLGGENWPTTCAEHVGTTWQTFLPNYLVGAFITTLRLCVRKLKAPTLILHSFWMFYQIFCTKIAWMKLHVCNCSAIFEFQLAKLIFLNAAWKIACRKVSSDFLYLVSISSYLKYSMFSTV